MAMTFSCEYKQFRMKLMLKDTLCLMGNFSKMSGEFVLNFKLTLQTFCKLKLPAPSKIRLKW